MGTSENEINTKAAKTGKELERWVAEAYRAIGARKVEHDVELAGHQIDVYVELVTPDRSLHRIAVEAKDYTTPVGIKIVSEFSDVVDRLRRERLIDEGVVVSSAGFSRPARNAAETHGLRLLEPADLDAMIAQAEVPPSLHAVPQRQLPHNLPPRSDFVGREAEKKRVHEALQSRSYLISIDGIGGIGKTALALEVAYECLHASQGSSSANSVATFDGFIWTTAKDRDLALDDLLDAVARTLYCPDITKRPIEEKRSAVRGLLQARPYLLVVDNFEAITDDGVRDLLLNLPEPSKALITTREKKLLDARMISLKRLKESEGLDLIRSEGTRLGLASVEQAEGKLLLCLYECAGGAPLAIKWAVGQIKQKGQSLDAVLTALHGARASIFEHIFARSWELLSVNACQVLTVMPVFVSPALRAGIEAANDVQGDALNEALGQLVEMSLVDATDELDLTRRRYSIHPLTRSFAGAKLQQEPEVKEDAHQRLAEFYRSFTKEHGGFWHPDRFAQLEPELPNLLTIIQWCQAQQRSEVGLDILRNILGFIVTHGYWNDVLDRYPLKELVIQQIEAMGHPISSSERSLLENACEEAVLAHTDQTRDSGEPYISHAVAVGLIAARVLEQMDARVVAAALTHDVSYAGPNTLARIDKILGTEVLALVNDALEIRKMLNQPGQDLDDLLGLFNQGAVLIKLADRLHNMQTIRFLPPDEQEEHLRDTRNLYIPLARRAGYSQIAEELENAVKRAEL